MKKGHPSGCPFFGAKLALLTHLGEAVATIDGTVRLRLEGNLRLATAGSTHGSEVLTGAAGGVLAGVTAGLAALGLVLEATLSVELLLTGGEGKLVAALFAYQDLVFVHRIFPLFDSLPNRNWTF
jgi:hypothetical protein